jgi:hypothetical protein
MRAREVPPVAPLAQTNDTAADEVIGWAALDNQNYPVAAARFETCWESAKRDNVIELGALHGWHRAKALYLQGRGGGDSGALARSFQALDEAITRGGKSSWFNRMRASLLRARTDMNAASAITEAEYAEAVLRVFDERLERVGTIGDRYQKYLDRITERLSSFKHAEYQEGLELLGELIGYTATRPKFGAATDCRWRGAFGQAREVFTIEAKIEHTASTRITASDLGQAHNQRTRAEAEFNASGYTVRGMIATHMVAMNPDAVSSIGPIAILPKEAVLALWRQIGALLSGYRAAWSLDDIAVRARAAVVLRPVLPRTGWLVRALATGDPWVTADALTREWRPR